ncbi:MAG: class I tRNA ligase family protein, partial [Thermodesulfobacteriota bacterium]
DIIKKYGAEILRLWVSAEDYRVDIRISTEILDRLVESYRKIRNTFRYLIGNLNDFDPMKDRIEYENMEEIDRWILHKLSVSTRKMLNAYEKYEFHIVYHELQRFCIVDLSSIYLDSQKDLLYTFYTTSKKRRSAQNAMYKVLNSLIKLSAPILSFTADEVWKFIPGDKVDSVHLTAFPEPEFINDEFNNKWNKLLLIRDEILKALEIARNDKSIRSSLEAGVEIFADDDYNSFILENLELVRVLSIVSHVEVINKPPTDPDYVFNSSEIPGFIIKVKMAPGEKCERCWTFRESVGKNSSYPTICDRCVANLEERDI